MLREMKNADSPLVTWDLHTWSLGGTSVPWRERAEEEPLTELLRQSLRDGRTRTRMLRDWSSADRRRGFSDAGG